MESDNEDITKEVTEGSEELTETVEQPKAVIKRQRRSRVQDDDGEDLEQKIKRLEQKIEELSAPKKALTCCEHLFDLIDKCMAKRGELRVYKLKKTLEPNGYRYHPIDEKGKAGNFVIEGTRKNNTVMFVFKKASNKTAEGNGETVCAAIDDVICSAEVVTETDWLRAESEMVYKFNAVSGRRHNIIVGM